MRSPWPLDRIDAFTSADRRLLARVGSQLALAFRNARLYETIKTMHVGHLKALISAMNARDSYAVGHAARVAGYMLLLGRELGWHEERLPEITEAAFLHDVGRIGVADDVLFKPGKLSDAEMAELRHHPVVSAGIIQPLFGDDMVQADPSPPRALGRTGISGRPRWRADPGTRARPLPRRLVRRHVLPAPASHGAHL